jgi:branched-subunit amino acid transport protein
MEHFLMVAGMAGVTFLIRYSLLPLSGRIHFSEGLQRALGYVPPAVLTAIIAPAVMMPNGTSYQVSLSNPYLAGAVVTTAIGLVGKNLLVTIVGGMGFFICWQWVLKAGWL